MFNGQGRPTGYDQIAPGRDLPAAPNQSPLNQAIMGQQQPPAAPPQPPSQYQVDPTMSAWRTRQPGAQAPINSAPGMAMSGPGAQNFGAQTNAMGIVTNGISPIDGHMLGPNEGASVSGNQNYNQAPTAGSAPLTPGASAPASQGGLGGDPSHYALSLIQGGMDPSQAAQQTNSKFNLQTGSQAVYYPDSNTIGLPGAYLAGPTGRSDSPSAWGITQRTPEGPAHSAMKSPLMSAIYPGGAAGASGSQGTPMYQSLLQQLLQTQAQQQAQTLQPQQRFN